MKLLYITAFLLVSRVASADVCQAGHQCDRPDAIRAADPAGDGQCTDVEVTLHNSGKLPANIMGTIGCSPRLPTWRRFANAGMGAGLANNYQKPGDKRIVAATAIIGGGERHHGSIFHHAARSRRKLHVLLFGARSLQHHEGPLVYNAPSSTAVAKNEPKITTARRLEWGPTRDDGSPGMRGRSGMTGRC